MYNEAWSTAGSTVIGLFQTQRHKFMHMPRRGRLMQDAKRGGSISARICDRRATKSCGKRPAARRVVCERLAGFVARSSQIHADMLVARASPASLSQTTAGA